MKIRKAKSTDAEQTYLAIWQLAKPYYLKGRPMDIDHIEWMIQDAIKVCQKENLDETLLLPLVILHDVGYSKIPKDNPFKLNLRKAHMEEGKKISHYILNQLDYPPEKVDRISNYISIHDNWALSDNKIYQKDKILGTFNDLDFIWMITPKGFPALKKILNKNDQEMINFIEKNEKLINRPFSTKTTKDLFNQYLSDIKNKS